MLSPQIDRELARKKSELTIAGRVKWVLMRLLGGRSPEIHDVAKELGMSCRTLQRRITAEQTTFRRLISDARRELARYYLLQPALELAEVACLLGYEDSNSFFRAFREWEGTTPSEWRRGWIPDNAYPSKLITRGKGVARPVSDLHRHVS